jgi:protein SCO1/2
MSSTTHRLRLANRFLLIAGMLVMPHAALSAPFSFYNLPATFVNDAARTVKLSEWRGKPVIVTMEYSECRFMCTSTFSKMKAIQQAADQKGIRIDFVVISLDPQNDTPAAWKQYRASRGIERDNWHLLTGSDATTREFAALVGIKYWYMDRHLLHDFKIVRLDGDGVIAKEITEYDIDPDYLLQ